MAEQNSNPPPWTDDMSDGCSGVPNKYPFLASLKPPCVNHDRAYHYGGHRAARKRADQIFRVETRETLQKLTGWRKWLAAPVVYGLAEARYWGVRGLGWWAFNKLGPGLPEDNARA